LDTLYVEEQIIETISYFKDKIDILFKIKSLYDVNFGILIVPTIIDGFTPAISINKEIIDFCYKTGTEIDIDMYVYPFNDKEY